MYVVGLKMIGVTEDESLVCELHSFPSAPVWAVPGVVDCLAPQESLLLAVACITCIVSKTSLSRLERLGPIDRTPGIPGSDKNVHECLNA